MTADPLRTAVTAILAALDGMADRDDDGAIVPWAGYLGPDGNDHGAALDAAIVDARAALALSAPTAGSADAMRTARDALAGYPYDDAHWRNKCQPAIAAIDAALAQQAAPAQAGWVLAPEEPTLWMQQHALDVSRQNGGRYLPVGSELTAANVVYRAMLAARPAPPAASGEAVAKITHAVIRDARRDAIEVFDAEGPGTPQLVRDVIEYMVSWLQVYVDRAATPQPPAAPAPAQPVEMSPEFTDTARAALLWVLWHHQGAGSPVGRPIRFALGLGAHEYLNECQIAEAKRWAELTRSTTAEFKAPAQRERLTDAEIGRIWGGAANRHEQARDVVVDIVRTVEAHYGIGTAASAAKENT